MLELEKSDVSFSKELSLDSNLKQYLRVTFLETRKLL